MCGVWCDCFPQKNIYASLNEWVLSVLHSTFSTHHRWKATEIHLLKRKKNFYCLYTDPHNEWEVVCRFPWSASVSSTAQAWSMHLIVLFLLTWFLYVSSKQDHGFWNLLHHLYACRIADS
jgi:hypothetical protein